MLAVIFQVRCGQTKVDEIQHVRICMANENVFQLYVVMYKVQLMKRTDSLNLY